MQARQGERERLRRAVAHLKSAVKYERQGLSKKAAAHFGRVMYYGTGDAGGTLLDLPDEILTLIFDHASDGAPYRNDGALSLALGATSKRIASERIASTRAGILRETRLFNRAKKALARQSTIEWVREMRKPGVRDEPDGAVRSLLRSIKSRVMGEWYHFDFCYEFHGLVDIKHGRKEDTTQEERTTCANMLQGFLDHLHSDQPCTECAILKRDETRGQIKAIIEGTFVPKRILGMETDDSARVIIPAVVSCYTGGKIRNAHDYGHLCVWRLDGVTNASRMFDASSFYKSGWRWNDEEWDVRLWDTRGVRSMESMFCANEGKLSGVETWNVESVENMSLMFRDAKNFNRDLSRWKLREGVNLSRMLDGAISMDSRRKPKMVVLKEAGEAAEAAAAAKEDEAAEEDEFGGSTTAKSARKGEKRR
jgi:hypothetical protein